MNAVSTKTASDTEDKQSVSVDPAISGAMAEIIINVADGDISHASIATPTDEHEVADIHGLLNAVGVTVEATEAAIARYLPAVTEAKEEAKKRINSANPKSEEKPKSSPKKPKQKATGKPEEKVNKTKAEPVLVATKKVRASDHQFPEKAERAKMVPLPEFFYLEEGQARSREVHQVDPARVESWAPVMPNVDLLNKTDNPYPAKADDTVKTSEKYQDNVSVSHATWEVFKTKDGKVKPGSKEFVAEVLDACGVSETNAAKGCIRDTLRDCANYGIVKQFALGRARSFEKA